MAAALFFIRFREYTRQKCKLCTRLSQQRSIICAESAWGLSRLISWCLWTQESAHLFISLHTALTRGLFAFICECEKSILSCINTYYTLAHCWNLKFILLSARFIPAYICVKNWCDFSVCELRLQHTVLYEGTMHSNAKIKFAPRAISFWDKKVEG
jgi:hypothetical protein